MSVELIIFFISIGALIATDAPYAWHLLIAWAILFFTIPIWLVLIMEAKAPPIVPVIALLKAFAFAFVVWGSIAYAIWHLIQINFFQGA